jgi:hypothetical protein
VYKLPLSIVQKQVGHKTLKTTSVYLRPSDEHVGQAYAQARRYSAPMAKWPENLNRDHTLSSYDDTRKYQPT